MRVCMRKKYNIQVFGLKTAKFRSSCYTPRQKPVGTIKVIDKRLSTIYVMSHKVYVIDSRLDAEYFMPSII